MARQLKFKDGDKKQVSFYFSKEEYKKFCERFPNMTSWFLSRCLKRAIDEKKFFEFVLTSDPIGE